MNARTFVLLSLFVASTLAAAPRRRIAAPPPPTACSPAILAGGYQSESVAIDDQYIYFGDEQGGLWRVAKTGGATTALGSLPNGDVALLLAVDDARIYVIAGSPDEDDPTGRLYSLPKVGGTPTTLASGIEQPYDLAIDSAFVYFLALGTPNGDQIFSDGKVSRISKDGGTAETLASGLSAPGAIAVDDTTVWFGESGTAIGNSSAGIRRMAKSGGTVTHVLDGPPIVALTLGTSDIYFATFDLQTYEGTIQRVLKTGGATTKFVDDIIIVGTMRLSSDKLYYAYLTSGVSGIDAIPLTGGSPITVKDVDLQEPTFVMDGCAVYYASAIGEIARTPR